MTSPYCSLTSTPQSPPRRLAPWRLPWQPRSRVLAAASGGAAAGDEETVEIRVCVNRTCSRQGSRETLAALEALAPPRVTVASCGCLGRCGAGPNASVVVCGSGGGVALVGHLGTAARAAQLLAQLTGKGFDPGSSLEALALRKKAERELEDGNATEAEALLSQAIGLSPNGGLHFMYKSRSCARLAMGENAGALADADESIRLSPEFPQAYLSQGDAFLAMGEWNAAEKAYATALHLDPSIRRSKSFKARIAKLQEPVSANDSP